MEHHSTKVKHNAGQYQLINNNVMNFVHNHVLCI